MGGLAGSGVLTALESSAGPLRVGWDAVLRPRLAGSWRRCAWARVSGNFSVGKAERTEVVRKLWGLGTSLKPPSKLCVHLTMGLLSLEWKLLSACVPFPNWRRKVGTA